MTDSQESRTEFEAWAISEEYHVAIYQGQYASEFTEQAWLGWNAAWNHRAPVKESIPTIKQSLTVEATIRPFLTVQEEGK
jgi:hypothetical protein